jgi:hypothetical protein
LIFANASALMGGGFEATDIFDGWIRSVREDDEARGVFG